MFDALVNAFRAPDIRRRILFVLGMLVVYRLLAAVPVPGVDQAASPTSSRATRFLQLLDLFSGGGLSQLLGRRAGREPVHQRLDHHAADDGRRARAAGAQREGEYGRNKINQYTRYLTVPLALLQAYGFLALLALAGRR